jgi:electron transport complex protein RnfE
VSLTRGLSKGLWTGAPVLHLALSLCAALAVSASLRNGPGLGAATASVLIGSGLVMAALRSLVPGRPALPARLVVAIVLIALAGILLARRAPALRERLATYLPVVAVDHLVLGRAEVFAAGLGFALAVLILGGLKERLDLAPLPGPLGGAPVCLITAGLIAMAFTGFSGMIQV